MIHPLPKSLDDPRISPYITLPSNDTGRQRAEIKKARFTRRRDFSPPSLSFPRATTKSRRSFQLYCKGVSLPEGETRERRGRDEGGAKNFYSNSSLRSLKNKSSLIFSLFDPSSNALSPISFLSTLLPSPFFDRSKEIEEGRGKSGEERIVRS